MWECQSVSFREDRFLEWWVFGNSFNNQICILHCLFHVQRWMNPAQDLLRFLFAYATLLNEAFEASLYHFHAVVNEALFDIPHRNIIFPDLCTDLYYAMSHQACS